MLRGLVNVAATLSLLLSLFLVVVWHLTRHTPRSFEFAYKGSLYQLTIHAGDFHVDNEPQRTVESHPLRLLVASIRSLKSQYDTLEHEMHVLALRSGGRPSAKEDQLFEAAGAIHDRITQRHACFAKLLSAPRSPANKWGIPIVPCLARLVCVLILRCAFSCYVMHRRRSLRKQNRCPHCSYDLRATPSRCPECGTEFPANPSPPLT